MKSKLSLINGIIKDIPAVAVYRQELGFYFSFFKKKQINASLEQYFYCNSFLVYVWCNVKIK